MKRLITAALALIMMLTGAGALAAHGSISYSGAVDAPRDLAIDAPFKGSIETMSVKVGDVVKAGAVIATMRSDKVYSPVSGTVAAIFADIGYDATAVSERYTGVVFIEPTNKYTLYVNKKYAYESVSALYPHLGDTVYLRCVTDGSHLGTGILTGIADDGTYTVKTTAGEFYPGEAVRAFNKPRMYGIDRIGRGTIVVSKPESVPAKGYIIERFINVGDTVEKGQLIMETVEGLNDFSEYKSRDIVSPVDGIITSIKANVGESVSARGVVARVCPLEDMSIKVYLTEEDLASVSPEDKMEIVFEQVPGELRLEGTVSRISFLPKSVLEPHEETEKKQSASEEKSEEQAEDTTVYYPAYVDFPATDGLRLGMTATLYSIK